MRPLAVIKGEIVHALAEMYDQDRAEALRFLSSLYAREIEDPFVRWHDKPDPTLQGAYYVRRLDAVGVKKIATEMIYVEGGEDGEPMTYKIGGTISSARPIDELINVYEFSPVIVAPS